MPIIGLIAGALFGGSSLVAVSAYFIGMAAIICSGIILKKTKILSCPLEVQQQNDVRAWSE